MKKIFLFLISCILLLSVQVFAQNVKYIEHVIAQGETLSMIASKYKTTVGDIMRLNGMHADSKLSIGQKIKIPSGGQTVERSGETKTNTTPSTPSKPVTTTATKKSSKELTHVVEPKETMYSISKKYGITIQQLQEWNYKKDNSLDIGEVLAINVNGIPEAIKKRQEMSQQKSIAAVPNQEPPLVVKDTIKVDNAISAKSVDNTSSSDAVTKEKAVEKVDNTAQQTKDVAVKPEEKAIQTPVISEPKKERPTTNAAADGSDNFFAKDFSAIANGRNESNATGTAMIFKTASGWNDKKYYILMNDAPSGSIVKISSNDGRVVYAKVLWRLDDMKQNKGLQFRISEAAAAALNVQGDKFPLTIQYYQ